MRFNPVLIATLLVLIAAPAASQPPVPGFVVHLRSDAGLNTNGNLVESWVDQSPNGFVMSAAPGKQPSVTTSAGLPRVRFEGSEQLEGSLGLNLTQASVFCLFRYNVPFSDSDYLYTLGTPGSSGSQMTLSRRDGALVYHYDGATANFPASTCIPSGQFQVFSQLYGDTCSDCHDAYQNGELVLASAASNPYSADTNTAIIGNWSSGSFNFVGDLVEFIVYDRVLTPTERMDVEAYLRARGQLPDLTDFVDLRNFTVEQYEFNRQPDASWVLCGGGTAADQLINADASILLSDFEISSHVVRGRMGAGNAPDYMGFVFGYQGPGNYYLFDWKKTTASYESWAPGNVGMTLRIVDVVGGGDPEGQDLWESVDSANVTTLRDNSIPWEDGVDYTFSLYFTPGHFEILILEEGNVLERWSVDDSRYASGKVGYFINSLQNVRFGSVTVDALTSAPDVSAPPPRVLRRVAPNPFNPRASIELEIPRRALYLLDVFDGRGRHVVSLHRGVLEVGPHQFSWAGRTAAGQRVASGAYWLRLRSDFVEETTKLTLLK